MPSNGASRAPPLLWEYIKGEGTRRFFRRQIPGRAFDIAAMGGPRFRTAHPLPVYFGMNQLIYPHHGRSPYDRDAPNPGPSDSHSETLTRRRF